MSDSETKNATQINIHSVRNILGHSNQLTLFSEQHTKLTQTYGSSLVEGIDRFGIDLTDIQMRVVEGILRGFTQTNYKGNIAPEDKESIAYQKYSGRLPDTYKYVREIPRMRVTQKQIIEWAGLNAGSMGDKERAVNALCQLGIMQFCVLYDRLAFSENGEPEKDKNGNWKKELVTSVDTLFNIKIVREESPDKNPGKEPKLGDIKYYEISPSGIFLDQRETYFILIPFNWREEVHALYGKKKISAYVFRFLWFLRFQYELKRRKNFEKKPFQIRWGSEEIAIALKMPRSVYKRQKDRMNQILDESYSVAKNLGYLSSYERTGTVDILVLQDAKFSTTQNPTIEKAMGAISNNVSPALNYLFELFHKKKKELNHYHETPVDQEKEEQLREFNLLLSQKKAHEIEELINWGLSQKYWCSRLSTPQNLRMNFDDAWCEMNAVAKKQISSNDSINHKKIAVALRKMILEKRSDIEITLLNTAVTVKKIGTDTVKTIDYHAKDFKKQIDNFLNAIKIPFSVFASYLDTSD